MAKTLIEKFNEETNGEFDFIKLNAVEVNITKQNIDLILLYPSDKENSINAYKDKILQSINKIFKTSAMLNVKFKKSFFDFAFFKSSLFAFLIKYPSISNTICDGDVLCNEHSDAHLVTLQLEKSVFDYCKQEKLQSKIERFIKMNYCEDIRIELVSKDDSTFEIAEKVVVSTAKLVLDEAGGRLIRPQNVEDFIGGIIYEPAIYIEDAKSEGEGVVLCGTITRLTEHARKAKSVEKDSDSDNTAIKIEKPNEDKKFYKFILTDISGSINCIYFPSKKTIEQFGLLKEGKQIVCKGRLQLDTYKGDGSYSYSVRDISLCTIDKNLKVNRLKRKIPDEYSVIFPSPYVVTEQASLFDAKEKDAVAVSKFLLGKTFCVFDLETTGFSPDFDQIIEIGAVKMIDGIITETFTSLVDPLVNIPERITTLTNICNKDVIGKPLIDDVLLDFTKFCDSTILVGHNVQFDLGFISAKGKPSGIYFDHEHYDTLNLARKYFPKLGKYKLDTLVKHFNLNNQGAHRGLNDALVTAQLFYEISKMM